MGIERGRIVIIDGEEFVATIFSGDGKLYDERRTESDPIRHGSMLLRAVEKSEAEATTKLAE